MQRIAPRFVPAVCAALGLAGSGCAPVGPDHPDVLLITIDTLRPDHMGLYGYARDTTPSIDRFFADGLRFERAYATEASTSPSVVSLLSGRYPQDHGVRLFYQLLGDDVALLTERLPDAYQSAAFVSNMVLTDEAIGLARRFDHYDDFVEDSERYRNVYERNARKTSDAALAWLAGSRDPERPLFLWVHYIDPHGPYQPPPDRPRRFEHEGFVAIEHERIFRYQIEPGVDDALDYVDRYDEEIAYLDAQLGRLLDGYDRLAGADDALVVFTADHGESMLEHVRWFAHGYHVWEEIVRVPLLIRGPGVPAGTSDRPVSGIDLAPTILAALGARPLEDAVGLDLRRPARLPAGRALFVEGTQGFDVQVRGVVQRDRKWIVEVEPASGATGEPRLYDLARDPGELAPLAGPDERPLLDALMARIAADPDPGGRPLEFAEGVRIDAPKVAPRASAEALERLRALGYVE